MESHIIEVGHPNNRSSIRVYEGGKGPELLFLHGAGGLFPDDPFLESLASHYHVYAPLLPGFEDSEGGDHLRNMLDFTLHAFDVFDALSLHQPLVVGHSMGGMIAAEMAAIAPSEIQRLALLAPAGLWKDDHPIEDLFSKLPFELPALLLHDPEKNGALLSSGGNFNDPDFLSDFLVGNARRLGMAGKLLFPVPDRGLRDRLYRITAHTAIIWGRSDRLIPPLYGEDFVSEIPSATLHNVEEAGHMLQYEQTEAVIKILATLHN